MVDELAGLGARARQVLEALYRRGEASAQELQEAVPGLPSYSATRSVLRQLQQKGLVRRREGGSRYLYRPALSRSRVSREALEKLLDDFFGGSPEATMEALLDFEGRDVDWDRMEELVRRAREEGR